MSLQSHSKYPSTSMSSPNERSSDATFMQPDRRSVPLSTYLEQVTILLLHAVDSRSRARLEEIVNAYFAPTLQLSGYIFPGVGTTYASPRQAYVDSVLAFTTAYDFRVHAHNVTALVDEANGTAQVFATVTAAGAEEASEGLNYESVLLYHFERRANEGDGDEEWIVWRLEFMCGPGTYWLEGGWRS